MKTKMREKVRPKMGKIDIDYQKLHDAFFKWQMKPKLTIHGDLYYEVLGGTLRTATSHTPLLVKQLVGQTISRLTEGVSGQRVHQLTGHACVSPG